MKIRFLAASVCLGLLVGGPVAAAPKQHHGPRQAWSHYDYASALPVREGFQGAARIPYHGREDFYAAREGYYRQSGEVVENLRGDFTGGVGYGANGDADYFIDGYGQTHFFVGGFQNPNRLPHGPYRPRRLAPGRRF